MKSAIYAGSFDPIHYGHLDIINRAAKLTEKLYVAVLGNSNKNSYLNIEDRVNLVKQLTKDVDNIEVVTFEGLLFDYVEENNICAIVKGLRNYQDFQYEYNLASGITAVKENIETIVLFSTLEYSYLSSSLVRDFANYSEDLEKYVPKEVKEVIINKNGR